MEFICNVWIQKRFKWTYIIKAYYFTDLKSEIVMLEYLVYLGLNTIFTNVLICLSQ